MDAEWIGHVGKASAVIACLPADCIQAFVKQLWAALADMGAAPANWKIIVCGLVQEKTMSHFFKPENVEAGNPILGRNELYVPIRESKAAHLVV